MTECEHMLTELQEKVIKWKSAGKAVQKLTASDREKSDFKMIEEEYLGLQRRVGKCVEETGNRRRQKAFCRAWTSSKF